MIRVATVVAVRIVKKVGFIGSAYFGIGGACDHAHSSIINEFCNWVSGEQ